MLAFIRETPREIEEAAHVDGVSVPTLSVQIILPLAKPGAVATGILAHLQPERVSDRPQNHFERDGHSAGRNREVRAGPADKVRRDGVARRNRKQRTQILRSLMKRPPISHSEM